MMKAIRFGSQDKSGVHILFFGDLYNKLCISKKVEWDYFSAKKKHREQAPMLFIRNQ